MYEKIKKVTSLIHSRISESDCVEIPRIGIILGSGLGDLARQITSPLVIPYGELPDFPQSTVAGHQGSFVIGFLEGRRVIVMSGRVHFYEGYTMQQVTMPVRVMRELGVETLIVSNASGGVNTSFHQGDIMLITDHINHMPNPLIGANDERFGVRFPSMHNAYDKDLQRLALSEASEMALKLQQGVYLGLTGPSFETPAEYKFFRTVGADAVGMSTVPEVIVARHGGMRVLGFSLVSNVVGEDAQIETSHEEVQEVGRMAAHKMGELVKRVVVKL